jgi:hypothetical protein
VLNASCSGWNIYDLLSSVSFYACFSTGAY